MIQASGTLENLENQGIKIPRVDTVFTWADRIGHWKARWGIHRMRYAVAPGLYAVGNPDSSSPVFISANYKMSFDHVRRSLSGINSWILVLDTKGINVWCAAGKGTFGTDELCARIQSVQLEKVVSHKKVIVPQLGAVGVSAHLVKQKTDFSVIYGPVLACDIPAFLNAGMKTTEDMRTVHFGLIDRLILTPIELVQGLKYGVIASAVMLLLSGISSNGYNADAAVLGGIRSAFMLFTALLCGVFLGSVFLPFIPGKAFAWKGFLTGIAGFGIAAWIYLIPEQVHSLEILAWALSMSAISSFITMNFTGASTYTSLSGVLKEMKIAIPVQIAGIVIALVLWVIARFQ